MASRGCRSHLGSLIALILYLKKMQRLLQTRERRVCAYRIRSSYFLLYTARKSKANVTRSVSRRFRGERDEPD